MGVEGWTLIDNLETTNLWSVFFSNNHIVNQMPLLGSKVHPGCFVSGGLAENGISDKEIVCSACPTQEVSIAVTLAYAMSANVTLPCHVIGANSGIEVTKNYQLVCFRCLSD